MTGRTGFRHAAGMLLIALGLPLASLARADGGGSTPSADPALVTARAAIERQDFNAAAALLTDYLRHHADDADGWNWLGYAERQRGRLQAAYAAYERALKLNPDHRGAREYLGEAYLQDGNLAGAETQLAVLDRLCWLPCAEHSDLKAAIAAYKARAAAR